jgi:hypothetical protein
MRARVVPAILAAQVVPEGLMVREIPRARAVRAARDRPLARVPADCKR